MRSRSGCEIGATIGDRPLHVLPNHHSFGHPFEIPAATLRENEALHHSGDDLLSEAL